MDLHSAQERKRMEPYVGNLYQLGGTRHYRLTQGGSDGCRCIDVRTGSGFDYTVVCDRGMDLSLASYRGINLVYLTDAAETHPAFYDPWENEWLRTFSAGLLTTCGPSYLGPPCEDQGKRLGLHGRFSTLSARQVCDLTSFENGCIMISGQLHDSTPFGNKVTIRRTIRSEFGQAGVVVEDEIRNEGSKPVPLTMLYHVNFGYPLLSEAATIHVPAQSCRGYDDYTQERIGERFTVLPPDGAHLEKNYLHTFDPEQETAKVWIWNRELEDGLAVYLKFSPKQMPYLTQWMLEDYKDYVLALEPSNTLCESRSTLREMGILPMIEPGQTCRFALEIGVLHGNERISEEIGE